MLKSLARSLAALAVLFLCLHLAAAAPTPEADPDPKGGSISAPSTSPHLPSSGSRPEAPPTPPQIPGQPPRSPPTQPIDKTKDLSGSNPPAPKLLESGPAGGDKAGHDAAGKPPDPAANGAPKTKCKRWLHVGGGLFKRVVPMTADACEKWDDNNIPKVQHDTTSEYAQNNPNHAHQAVSMHYDEGVHGPLTPEKKSEMAKKFGDAQNEHWNTPEGKPKSDEKPGATNLAFKENAFGPGQHRIEGTANPKIKPEKDRVEQPEGATPSGKWYPPKTQAARENGGSVMWNGPHAEGYGAARLEEAGHEPIKGTSFAPAEPGNPSQAMRGCKSDCGRMINGKKDSPNGGEDIHKDVPLTERQKQMKADKDRTKEGHDSDDDTGKTEAQLKQEALANKRPLDDQVTPPRPKKQTNYYESPETVQRPSTYTPGGQKGWRPEGDSSSPTPGGE